MRTSFILTVGLIAALTAVAALASAIEPHAPHCPLKLSASGPPGSSANGMIVQIEDGQVRIRSAGRPLPAATFYFTENGGMYDLHGRGCILTPGVTQFQCDDGASPTLGFDNCNGYLSYNNNTAFHACPVNDLGEWNIYVLGAPGQTKCVPIKLTASGQCIVHKGSSLNASATSNFSTSAHTLPSSSATRNAPLFVSSPNVRPSPIPPVKNGSTLTSPSQSPLSTHVSPAMVGLPSSLSVNSAVCATGLGRKFEFPHLIISIDKERPDEALGNSFNGTFTESICTAFNFDIPLFKAGKTCAIEFLFPRRQDLTLSSYDWNYWGGLRFFALEGPVDEDTTWNNAPGTVSLLKQIDRLRYGSNYSVYNMPCWKEAGNKIAIGVCGINRIELSYFQNLARPAIGLYINTC